MEATRRELEAYLTSVEAGNRRAGGDGPGANITTVKLPKLNGATNWAVFRRQFETAEVQNNWTQNEKSTHLFSVLQGQAADILHTVLANATCEDIVVAFRDSFGKQQLAASYRSQLNDSVHKSGGRYRILPQQWSSWYTEPLLDFLSPFFKKGPPMLISKEYGTGS